MLRGRTHGLLGASLVACLGCAAEPSTQVDGSDTRSDDGGRPWVDTPDGGGVALACDLWAQDCPAGEKCMPWASDDSASWDATRCTAVVSEPAQPGDACSVVGDAWSGIDDCALGSMCWAVDGDGVGTCVAFCGGSPDAPSCASDDQGCSISNGGVLVLCLPYCDPLAQDCPAASACYPEARGFFCSPDASDDLGAFGDPCAYLNACDPGSWCAAPSDVPGCASTDGCCSAICDASDAGGDEAGATCPGVGQICEPLWEPGTAPPGQSAYGLCVIPD